MNINIFFNNKKINLYNNYINYKKLKIKIIMLFNVKIIFYQIFK